MKQIVPLGILTLVVVLFFASMQQIEAVNRTVRVFRLSLPSHLQFLLEETPTLGFEANSDQNRSDSGESLLVPTHSHSTFQFGFNRFNRGFGNSGPFGGFGNNDNDFNDPFFGNNHPFGNSNNNNDPFNNNPFNGGPFGNNDPFNGPFGNNPFNGGPFGNNNPFNRNRFGNRNNNNNNNNNRNNFGNNNNDNDARFAGINNRNPTHVPSSSSEVIIPSSSLPVGTNPSTNFAFNDVDFNQPIPSSNSVGGNGFHSGFGF